MFLFGISYAIASLSCTIGPFLAVTTSTVRSESWISGLAVFVAYGLGMGVIIAILTVAVALAKSGVVQRFRNALPIMNKVAGGLLLLAGAYVAYYGWYEIRVLNGQTKDPIIDQAIEVQQWLQNKVVPDNPTSFAIGAIVLLGVLAAVTTIAKRVRQSPESDSQDASDSLPSTKSSMSYEGDSELIAGESLVEQSAAGP